MTDAEGRRLIRANQGHTLAGVAAAELLTPITNAAMFPTVIHGTTQHAWQLILASGGLSRMARNHIHFAVGLPGASGVISGMRASCAVHVHIDMHAALRDHVPFFVSENNVVLSPGVGDTGVLPLKYVQCAKQYPGGSTIYTGTKDV